MLTKNKHNIDIKNIYSKINNINLNYISTEESLEPYQLHFSLLNCKNSIIEKIPYIENIVNSSIAYMKKVDSLLGYIYDIPNEIFTKEIPFLDKVSLKILFDKNGKDLNKITPLYLSDYKLVNNKLRTPQTIITVSCNENELYEKLFYLIGHYIINLYYNYIILDKLKIGEYKSINVSKFDFEEEPYNYIYFIYNTINSINSTEIESINSYIYSKKEKLNDIEMFIMSLPLWKDITISFNLLSEINSKIENDKIESTKVEKFIQYMEDKYFVEEDKALKYLIYQFIFTVQKYILNHLVLIETKDYSLN